MNFKVITCISIIVSVVLILFLVIERIIKYKLICKLNEEFFLSYSSLYGSPVLFSEYVILRLLEEADKYGVFTISNHPFEQRQLSEEDLIALKNLRHACRHQTVCDALKGEDINQ